MRVLVTGSSGFIGKAVATELASCGHEVVPFDRHNGDVVVAHYVRAAMDGAGAVINLAGVLGTPELFGSERRAAQANIIGAINVYETAAMFGIPVVQIGTGHKGQPNPYAITKACAEDLGLARAQWMGEKINVVRAYHVYGPEQIPGPPFGKASVHKFFPTFACAALSGANLELCGGGQQEIDPVHVTDVARVLVDAIGGPYGEVLEAGNGKPVTVERVARDIQQAAAPAQLSWLVDVKGRAGEPPGASVVASSPGCANPWPYLVPETMAWYRDLLTSSHE